MHLSTQWIYAGMQGVRVGLNYQSMEFLFKIYRAKNRKEVFQGLQVMEIAVLSIDAKNAKSGGK